MSLCHCESNGFDNKVTANMFICVDFAVALHLHTELCILVTKISLKMYNVLLIMDVLTYAYPPVPCV